MKRWYLFFILITVGLTSNVMASSTNQAGFDPITALASLVIVFLGAAGLPKRKGQS